MTELVRTDVDRKVQRAIEGRYLPDARADRRSAQASYKEAHQPAASTVGWSTKPAPSRKPSDVEKQRDARIAGLRLRWTKQHPDVARNERELRLARRDMIKAFAHKAGDAPENYLAATREGSLARLYRSEAIDAEQLASATQIVEQAERMARDVSVRTASLETRVDTNRHGDAFFEALGAVRREIAYRRWCGELGPLLPSVLAMIVDGVGFTVIAARCRMHHRRAKQLLLDALDIWPRVLGAVCGEVDGTTLLAAQAGILA